MITCKLLLLLSALVITSLIIFMSLLESEFFRLDIELDELVCSCDDNDNSKHLWQILWMLHFKIVICKLHAVEQYEQPFWLLLLPSKLILLFKWFIVERSVFWIVFLLMLSSEFTLLFNECVSLFKEFAKP